MTSRSGLVGMALATGALALSASCQVIYGLGDFRSGEEGGATPAAGSGGAGGAGAGSGAGGGEGGSPPCVCVGATPPGWTGPYRVYEHAPEMSVDTCSDGSAVWADVLVTPPEPTCGACSCDVSTGCTLPSMTCYQGTDCAGTGGALSAVFADTDCHFLGNIFGSFQSCRVTVPPAPGGCTPSGGELVPGAWGAAHAVCSAAPEQGGACADGGACVGPGSNGTRLCVALEGSAASCPDGWPDPIAGFRDPGPETRTCSPCSCGALTGITCSDAFRIHPGGNCNSFGADFTPPTGDCMSWGSSPRWAEFDIPAGGSCPPSTSVLQGSFNPGQPVTLCCLP